MAIEDKYLKEAGKIFGFNLYNKESIRYINGLVNMIEDKKDPDEIVDYLSRTLDMLYQDGFQVGFDHGIAYQLKKDGKPYKSSRLVGPGAGGSRIRF